MLIHREPKHLLPTLPTLRALMGWDPLRELKPMFDFEPLLAEPRFLPVFEVKETKASYVFKSDVPGVEEKDIEVTVTPERLTIGGKREEEKRADGETFFMHERAYGAFTRAFALPEGADPEHVTAELKGGVLTVEVAKKPEHAPRKVTVKAVIDKVKGALEKAA